MAIATRASRARTASRLKAITDGSTTALASPW